MEVASIVIMTAAVVATVVVLEVMVAATTIVIAEARRDTKTETTARTDVVTTMDHVALTAMLRVVAVMIVTAAVGMTVEVVEAMTEAMLVVMAMRPLLGRLVTLMEVDPPMTVQTIGTPVARLRSAELHRSGSLCEINAPEHIQLHDLELYQNC